jgi:uncharacterized protein YsxB (DUF464 family)
MITVLYTLNKAYIEGYMIKGHADLNIVCAAVSTAATITANAFERFQLMDTVDITIESGYLEIKVKAYSAIGDTLLTVLDYTIQDLKAQYPNSIHRHTIGVRR